MVYYKNYLNIACDNWQLKKSTMHLIQKDMLCVYAIKKIGHKGGCQICMFLYVLVCSFYTNLYVFVCHMLSFRTMEQFLQIPPLSAQNPVVWGTRASHFWGLWNPYIFVT